MAKSIWGYNKKKNSRRYEIWEEMFQEALKNLRRETSIYCFDSILSLSAANLNVWMNEATMSTMSLQIMLHPRMWSLSQQPQPDRSLGWFGLPLAHCVCVSSMWCIETKLQVKGDFLIHLCEMISQAHDCGLLKQNLWLCCYYSLFRC